MARLVEDERLNAMAGHQSVVVRLESEFEHGCVRMVRCRYQREDVLGRRLGRGGRRPALRQALSGSNFRKDIGRCAEMLLLQGHARMIIDQRRPLLVLRGRGRPAHIRHRWHPRVREGQHAEGGETLNAQVVRDRRADQRMVGKTKFKASEWPFPLVDFVLQGGSHWPQ